MTIFNDIFLSGWFQIVLLSLGFYIFSRRVIARRFLRGYALGWMLGLFFIVVYASLNPPQPFVLGGYDGELNMLQVSVVSLMGLFLAIGIAIFTALFPNSYRWQALRTAFTTAILVIALFGQVVTTPDIRIMISLFVLAFAISALVALILRRDTITTVNNEPEQIESLNAQQTNDKPTSRVGYVRQRIVQRINRNNVPTDPSVSPY
ncbi:MAG: hypothetical protein AAF846_27830 [Chloroflexota bacterium]